METPSEFEGTVRGLSSEGLGVVEHPSGRVFFVKGAWPGDKARFVPTRFEKRYGYADMQELLEASPDRVSSPCPHQGFSAGQCGGCPWMIGNYESQLRFKEHRVRHAVERAGILKSSERLLPIWGSQPLAYRNRAQFKTDGKRLGFVSDESHVIAPIQDCLILTDTMRERLKGALASLPREDWRPTAGHEWCFVEIDDALGSDEEPWLNKRRPFMQGNTAQNQRMREWLAGKIEKLAKGSEVLELFCGSGNFTEVLAHAGFQKILALEAGKDAIDALEAKGLRGVEAHVADVYHPAVLRKLARVAADTRVLVLDPPRTGAKGVERLVQDLKSLERIFYISCDVATFVRDAASLTSKGFEITEIQPLDLFPHTSHVEVLCEFTLRS